MQTADVFLATASVKSRYAQLENDSQPVYENSRLVRYAYPSAIYTDGAVYESKMLESRVSEMWVSVTTNIPATAARMKARCRTRVNEMYIAVNRVRYVHRGMFLCNNVCEGVRVVVQPS